MFSALIQGFFLGASLIIAIGAQNAYVIRQGIRGRYVFWVCSTCFLVDSVLITIGAAGLGSLIAGNTLLRDIAAWGGAAFLAVYGARAAWAALRPTPVDWDAPGASGVRGAVGMALAVSLLNPHVYVDTVVLIGGIAAQFAARERVLFAVGAVAASAVWFYGTGYGAARVAPFFRTRTGQVLLDAVICVIMWSVAASLVAGALKG